jgi:hypothetical protein
MHQHSSELRGSEILEVGGLRNENYKLRIQSCLFFPGADIFTSAAMVLPFRQWGEWCHCPQVVDLRL